MANPSRALPENGLNSPAFGGLLTQPGRSLRSAYIRVIEYDGHACTEFSEYTYPLIWIGLICTGGLKQVLVYGHGMSHLLLCAVVC